MREGGRVWGVGHDVMLEECDVIVMRDAVNKFGPVGCEHISAALRGRPTDATSTWWSLVMEPALVGPANSIQSLT